MTKRPGTLGPILPTTARGHCGFVTSWAVRICGAPATVHHLHDNPVCNMFVCDQHAGEAVVLLGPVDRHPVASECVHPGSEWRMSGVRPGFCFVPSEDVELVNEFQEVGAR
jgi:hypothetical protein